MKENGQKRLPQENDAQPLRADQDLRLLETLELVTRQVAAAVARCNRDLRYVWVNQAYVDWIQRPLAEIVGHLIVDVLGKEAFQHLRHHFECALSGKKVTYEEEIDFHGIGRRWVSATYTPTFDGGANANGWVAVVLDVTEKKRAEEARLRHAAIVESSEDAIISKTLDAIITSWNAGAERMFGYREEEVVGQPITILVPPDLRDEENKILERLRAGRLIEHYETVRMTKAGKRVDVSLSISPVKDSVGRIVGFTEIAHDITKRKRAEEVLQETNRALEKRTAELQAREHLLKIFVENVPAGVAMFDRDMRYLQVSDRWCADYSVDRSQVLGRSHYELFSDIPDRWKQVHRRALEGEIVRADEDRWDREDGTRWLHWEVRPWLNLDGLPGGILIFAEDITSRKQMEQSLSRKLIQAHEEERTWIARELHDDIGQRVALLAMNLHALKRGFPASEKTVGSQIEEIRKRAVHLGNDIQALSHRLHSSNLEYLGLKAAVTSFCEEFSMRQSVETSFHFEDIPKDIPAEVALCLFRVLQEALQNGAKHSGVKQFEVSLKGSLNRVDLTVHDSGRGFDAAGAMTGHGLGLTSMRERLELAGGQLLIESKPESGTTIHACVPLSLKVKSAGASQ